MTLRLGTVSIRVKKLRSSPEYKKWHDTILKRDNYKCVICGSNERLEVDHIKPLALNPHLALDLNNGRVLCHKCHEKTDTYGQLAKFKNDAPIHPILTGDYLYKIETLPSSIEIGGIARGLTIFYNPDSKYWSSGYIGKKINLTARAETVDKSIDGLFKILTQSAGKSLEEQYKINNENYMVQQSTKLLRQELYGYIEKILNRELSNEERQEISAIFRKSIKSYFESVYIEQNN